MSFLDKLFSANKNKVKDPVCKMMVDPEKAEYKSNHDGKTYYFCSENCQKTFEADPQNYAS
ncbi:MAG: cation transporting P-type ATPase, Cu2+-exporting ATPase [Candidatus Gottesmanbacteria bacterium GW2011_GWA2_43_14]|uniref:Cation transporting P-type ATPase, Cu2+-exporting ATPase n=1 Tax=Candidatus Gottesmanbacteria bacterium GW2011_GWA2_43_14 TaxID=1618443 RepID=A0A0G1DK91_9BACT|nr:MAG: cation transporting P-type ATPase, Cu2+-exporting ATPase [Candidatus Gottesmanbacteria bacterium GW2011_GWA2_43_14]